MSKSLGPFGQPLLQRAELKSCYHAIMPVEIKSIGASGQISLGKQYAGRTVTVEQIAEGVWTIKTAQVIPDDELWLHTPDTRTSLDRALEWSASHPRSETDLKAITKRVNRNR
jgi:putative transposon-encoded protein